MPATDLTHASFQQLIDLSESRFHSRRLSTIDPERKRRFDDLTQRSTTSSQRSALAVRLYRESLEREVRERIATYAAVANESGSLEMRSAARLVELRQRIMKSVALTMQSLRDKLSRDAVAAGDVPLAALPDDSAYGQINAEILDVVLTELRVLEMEGKAMSGRTAGGAVLGDDQSVGPVAPAAPQRGRRGVKPDHESALRVAEIVAEVAPDGNWRQKLDDVCEVLDGFQVPLPRRWRCREWQYYTDRANAVKAIEYRLETARKIKRK